MCVVGGFVCLQSNSETTDHEQLADSEGFFYKNVFSQIQSEETFVSLFGPQIQIERRLKIDILNIFLCIRLHFARLS